MPKYKLVEEYVRDYIKTKQLSRGSLLPSERQLAESLNVHVNTIKYALNNLVNEGVIYREQGKGTFVNDTQDAAKQKSRLDAGKKYTIGVIVPDVFMESICSAIVRGIQDVSCDAGVGVLLGNSDNDFEKFSIHIEQFLERNIDGLIAMLPQTNSEQWKNYKIVSELLEKNIPFVLVDRYLKHVSVDCVCSDNERGGRMITEHLIELGHEKIAFVCESMCSSIEDRLVGYKVALAAGGIPFDESLVVTTSSRLGAAGLEGIQRLMENKREFTAVICSNDSVARGAFRALKSYGLNVPQDVSLVGYDDSVMAKEFQVPLTTVRQPAYEMGRTAAELCLERISGCRSEPSFVELKSELIKRASTAVRTRNIERKSNYQV